MTGQAAGAGSVATRAGDRCAWTRASLEEDVSRRARTRTVSKAHIFCTPLSHMACEERGGPTPTHPEPGRETPQRRRYWRDARWESRSVRQPTRRGAVAARRAHNPKVGGSNPPAATIRRHPVQSAPGVFFVRRVIQKVSARCVPNPLPARAARREYHTLASRLRLILRRPAG